MTHKLIATDEATGDVEQRPVITLRFRRRTLWLALSVPVLAIAILTAAFLWQLYQGARLNAAIEARGGYVFTQYYSGRLPTAWQPWVGNQDSGVHTQVYLENCNVTDNWLATHNLSGLSGSLTISLTGNPIGDESVRHIAAYRRLSLLQLSETQITDDGLAYLRESVDLGGLYLDGTAVTDAGLANLDGMPNLSSLYVHETQVTDAGILHALNSHSLASLSVDASILTAEVATAVINEPVLYLTLHGDAIPNALPLLTNATRIQNLTLVGDSVTDNCVPDLAQLTSLKYLYLTNTRLTRDGFDRLREALPGCEMYVTLYQHDEEGE